MSSTHELSAAAYLPVLKSLAIAGSLWNAGSMTTAYRLLPAIYPTVSKSPQDAAKQWEAELCSTKWSCQTCVRFNTKIGVEEGLHNPEEPPSSSASALSIPDSALPTVGPPTTIIATYRSKRPESSVRSFSTDQIASYKVRCDSSCTPRSGTKATEDWIKFRGFLGESWGDPC